MAGFLPPISIIRGRGTNLAALWHISFQATCFEPVKTMPSIPSLSMSSWPAVNPGPVMKLKTPRGNPASIAISLSLAPMNGVSLAGLNDGVARRQCTTRRSCREREREIEWRERSRPRRHRPRNTLRFSSARAEGTHLLDEPAVELDLIAWWPVIRSAASSTHVADAFEPVLSKPCIYPSAPKAPPMVSNGVGDFSDVREPLLPWRLSPRRVSGARPAAAAHPRVLRALLKIAPAEEWCQLDCNLRTACWPRWIPPLMWRECARHETLRSPGDGLIERAMKKSSSESLWSHK